MYGKFFEEGKRYLPYEREGEYWKDLFSCLDLILASAGRQSEDRGQPEADIRKEIKSARMYIKSRILHTDQADQFRFRYLVQEMVFTEWECFLFLLAFSVSYDARYEKIYLLMPENMECRFPTLRLAVSLFEGVGTVLAGEIAAAIQRKGRLFEYFLEISQKEKNPVTYMISLDQRVCAFLYGGNEVGEEVSVFSEVFYFEDPLPPLWIRKSQKEHVASAIGEILRMPERQGNVIQLYGPEGIGKRFLLKSAAQEGKMNLLFINVSRLLVGNMAELRILFRKIIQESIFLGAIVCFTGYEYPEGMEEAEAGKNTPQGLCFLLDEIKKKCQIAVWISEEKADFLRRHKLHVLYYELPLLTVGERELLWRAYAAGSSLSPEVDLSVCASQYVLTPRSIGEVLWDAGIRAAVRQEGITREDIRQAAERQSASRLGMLASKIRSVYTWDDLVVDREQREQLENICNHVKYQKMVGEDWGFYRKVSYGRGLCVMFYGEPGTGKTMAAQVMANELGLELYRIDLSQIVSKYIGETEKNITDLFRRARNTNALLFFDEADALFSKRSEVRDSHDRNANAQTAHLLQKLEDYEGITVLATNYINNIDEAFKRRIRFMVHFVFPVPEMRLKLWETILPEELPLEEELDLEFFAENFELSGSSIREVLTNAAFCAVAAGRGMRNEDIITSIRLNFAKYGRTLTREDFGYLGGAMMIEK